MTTLSAAGRRTAVWAALALAPLMGVASAEQAVRPPLGLAFEDLRPFLLDVGQIDVLVTAEPRTTPPRADLGYAPTLARMAEAWGLARLAPDGAAGRVVYEVREAALTIEDVEREGGFFSFRFGAPDRRFEARIEISFGYEGQGADRRTIRSQVVVTGAAEIPRNASLEEVDRIYADWLRDLGEELDRRLVRVIRDDFPSLLD